jgi:hypothetical protein
VRKDKGTKGGSCGGGSGGGGSCGGGGGGGAGAGAGTGRASRAPTAPTGPPAKTDRSSPRVARSPLLQPSSQSLSQRGPPSASGGRKGHGPKESARDIVMRMEMEQEQTDAEDQAQTALWKLQ